MTWTIDWHLDEQRGIARHKPTGVEFLVEFLLAAGDYFSVRESAQETDDTLRRLMDELRPMLFHDDGQRISLGRLLH